MISSEEFQKVEMRVGRILEADPFPEARRPAYRLLIDAPSWGRAGVARS